MIELIPAETRDKYAAMLPSEPLTIAHLAKFVSARNINPRTLARLLLVEAELEQWRTAGAVLASEPCGFNTWGCHVHMWQAGSGPCPYGQIRELLATKESTDAT